MNPVLSVRDLRKRYGEVQAIDGVSFEIHAGEILGLLGPNGAGKTTTLECLEGLRRPDSGSVTLAAPGRKRSDAMGVQLQSGALPPDMTVLEAMRFFCAYRGVPPRDDLLERFGLDDKRTRRYGDLSVGNQRRLALALAIAHRPALVLFDEPTAGLDVESRSTLHAVIREIVDQGTAVLLATHDMAEAEKMAARVCILLKGRIVAEGTPRQLTASGARYTKVSVATERGAFASGGVPLQAAELKSIDDGYALYLSTDPAITVAALLQKLEERGDVLTDLRVERPTLEERFLEITTGGAR